MFTRCYVNDKNFNNWFIISNFSNTLTLNKMKKPVTKTQAKNATKVLAAYSSQESKKAYEAGKKGAIKAGAAAKVGLAKLKGLFK